MKKIYIVGFILVLVIMACTIQQKPTVTNTAQISSGESSQTTTPSDKAIAAEQNSETTLQDYDIVINNGRIDPREIRGKLGQLTLTIHNSDDKPHRIDILMYQSEVSETIEPGQYGILELSPTVTGRSAINIDGAQLGGITIE